jgi:hypothetical protein
MAPAGYINPRTQLKINARVIAITEKQSIATVNIEAAHVQHTRGDEHMGVGILNAGNKVLLGVVCHVCTNYATCLLC